VHAGSAPDGAAIVDGGRTRRTLDRFVAHLRPGVSARGIVRLDGPGGTHVRMLANGEPVGAFDLGEAEDWVECSFEIPAGLAGDHTQVELFTGGDPVTTFHYWFVIPG
jgi:hypothetical protein